VAVLAVVGVVRAIDTPRSVTIARYKQRAQRALQRRDFATAKVCYERLLSEPETTAEALFGLALTVEGQGDPARAVGLLVQAAPLDRPGAPEAHLELARVLLRTPNPNAATLGAAERHLLRVVDKGIGGPKATERQIVEASGLLGELYVALGKRDSALPFLYKGALARPELRLTLARAHQDMNMSDNAKREAQQALDEYQRRLDADPNDAMARLRAAEAASIMRDYARATEILSQGLSRTADSRFRSSLASVFAAWSDYLGKINAPLAERMLLLERGLQVDPSNGPLLERFGRILKTDGPEAEKVRARLRGLLSEGKATESVHFTLGVDAWLHGKMDAARVHFEEAYRISPRSVVVLNNLAWVLAHSRPPDLPRALKLIDLALDRQPNNVMFKGTRGVILAKLERWREALPELEAALVRDPQNADLHAALATTYEHLGMHEMAAEHRRPAGSP
jgi:tetratricopeptide (TPR) repeat protein